MGRQVWRPGNMLYPLPVVMVSCTLPGERPNIITVAWTGTICSDPAMVSISVRKSRYSHHIIKESGEFVINLTDESLVRAADYCGVKSGKDIDKFKECHLTELKSEKVAAPGIAESPVCIECRVKEIKELGSHDMFIAEVVSVSVDDRYMNKNGKFELADAKPVVYSHGEYYLTGKKLGGFGFSVKKRKKHESIHN
ncbi:MAG: flavin reductase family protein [Lachnospiraceae bacterium]|nr:flavin reductase family protein [Lachnospiraceae bacterium]MBR6274858.1 flavin reductase family protein [Lachnospiraceae bacterium]